MGRSSTWFVTARTIATQPELASVLVRLMLCNNDLSIVSNTIDEWGSTDDRKKLPRKAAGTLYFVRTLLSHIHEAFGIIKEISKSAVLRAAVDRCDPRTVAAFESVERYANSVESKSLGRMRNRAAFHYDQQLPVKVLSEIAEHNPERNWSYSMGTENLDWHFELADAVMDRILVREVYGQRGPQSPERHASLEAISLREQEIAREFTNFAAHFVRRFSK